MPTSIDELQIEINAKAVKANDAIDRLVGKLNGLTTSLGNLNPSNLNGLANGVQKLGTAMQTMKDVKKTDFNKVARGISAFEKIDSAKLSSLSTTLSPLATSIGTLGAVKFDNKNIQTLINSLTRLSNANLNSLANVNFTQFGNSINQLSASLSNTPKIQQSVISMTNAIANLSKSGANMPTVATSLQTLGGSLSNFMSIMASAPSVTDSTVTFTQAISSLANAGSKAGVTAGSLSILGSELKNLMATLSTAPMISQSIIDMTNALANLSTQGSKVGSASRSIQRSLNGTATSTARAKKGFNGLASAIGKFYASYFLVIRGIKGLWSSINTTADYIEAFNYYTVSFGKIASKWDENWENYGSENARNYSNSFVTTMNDSFKKLSGVSYDPQTGLLSETGLKNLGLNLQEVTQYAAQLGSMMDAVGHSGEVTLATTNAFVKLAGDISSLYNIDYSEASSKIRSVLQGQSRAGYGFGWDTTMASLQATADELNLSKAVSEMSQMEKQQLRILTILNQSRVAYGDQSNTINTLANQLRLLKNNIKEASMVLGQLFVPILSKLIPVINGTSIAIKRLLSNLASIFGIKIEDTGQGFTDMKNDAENLEDTYDDLAESIKEAKSQLLGFDEVNKLQDTSATATVDAEMGGIDLTDEILKATSYYEKIWQEAFARMEVNSNKWADSIEKALSGIGDVFEDFALGEYFKAGEDVSQLVIDLNNFIAKAIKNVDWQGIGNNVGLFLKGIKWTEVFMSLQDVIFAGMKGIFDFWIESMEESPIETALLTAIALTRVDTIRNALASKLATVGGTKMTPFKIGVYLTILVLGTEIAEDLGNKIGQALYGGYDPFIQIDARNKYEAGIQGIEDRYKQLEEKAKLYVELSKNYENLSAEDKQYVAQLGRELQVAGIVEGINEITGAWEKTNEELSKAIQQQMILAKLSSAQGRLSDIETQYAEELAKNKELEKKASEFSLYHIKYQKDYEKSTEELKHLEMLLQGAQADVTIFENQYKDLMGIIGNADLVDDAFKSSKKEESIWKQLSGDMKAFNKAFNKYGNLNKFLPLTGKIGSKKPTGLTSLTGAGAIMPEVLSNDAIAELDRLILGYENTEEEIERNPIKPNINNGRYINGLNSMQTLFNGVVLDVNNANIEPKMKSAGIFDTIKNIANTYNANKNAIEEQNINPVLSGTSIFSALTSIKSTYDTNKNTIEKSKIKPTIDSASVDKESKGIFNTITNNLKGIKTSVKVEADSASLSAFVGEIATRMAKIKLAFETKEENGGFFATLKKIQGFATGGFPEDGLFMANHGELVGKFSNGKTAVANNEQITQGIAQAVAPAVYNAFVSAMQDAGMNVNVSLQADTRNLFRVVQSEANNYVAQTGMPPFNI